MCLGVCLQVALSTAYPKLEPFCYQCLICLACLLNTHYWDLAGHSHTNLSSRVRLGVLSNRKSVVSFYFELAPYQRAHTNYLGIALRGKF